MIPGQILLTYHETGTPPPIDHGDATATVTGAAQEGQVLTCTFNNNDPDGLATAGPTFQWRNSSIGNIPGATGSTYVPQNSDVATNVFCRVSYTDGEGFAEVIDSNSIGPIADVVVGVFFLQDAAGVGSFNVPPYNTARLEVWGGGCGGSAANITLAPVSPSPGGNSSCTSPGISLVAEGGPAPSGGSNVTLQTQGAAANASGGNVSNTSGAVAGVGEIINGGTANSAAGGNSPTGEAGGASVAHSSSVTGNTNGNPGAAPGAGGSGNASGNLSIGRAKGTAGGNSGAYARSDYVFGGGTSPAVGALMTATVGAGSSGAVAGGVTAGGAGANGRVRFTVLS